MKKEMKDFYIKQIKEILDDYTKAEGISPFIVTSLITRAKATVNRITGRNSDYYKRMEEVLNRPKLKDSYNLKFAMGSLDALLHDLEKDYLESISELIHGEIFSDYLDMAQHLLEEGYKEASAVIGGSTLEEHLRKLCQKNNINIEVSTPKGLKPKKADVMNADLKKAGIYPLIQQKQVTTWLGIRNDAAHGHYNNYTEEQVKNMLIGLRDFFVRYLA